MKPTLLYIKVYPNRLWVKNLNTNFETSIEEHIFSNDHCLLAEITLAINALSSKKREILRGSWKNYIFAPYVLIQPLGLTFKKLSEVEEMLLHELVSGANITGNVLVWHGKELSDREAIEKIEKFVGKSFHVNFSKRKL